MEQRCEWPNSYPHCPSRDLFAVRVSLSYSSSNFFFKRTTKLCNVVQFYRGKIKVSGVRKEKAEAREETSECRGSAISNYENEKDFDIRRGKDILIYFVLC